jgi:tRNA-specific 2-thiouridylase
MSGGVDSSVAALLLKESGFEVVGVTMCLGLNGEGTGGPRCCGPSAIEDAKRVCTRLGISHYVFDFSQELEEKVIKRFVDEYLNGRTPNPCVDCNKFIKFGSLLKKAEAMGFDYLATGHYAKVEEVRGRCFLKRPKDKVKDQTYFLYPIKREALGKILFPLADLTKEEVRQIARENKLPVAEKPQSQDICFIPERDYRKFLSERIKDPKGGPIVDLRGKVLGRHKGIFFYTIGQRQGLGISWKEPLYVIAIDPKENKVIVGEKKDLKARGLKAKDLNLLVDELPKRAFAKLRYTHKGEYCQVRLKDNELELIFEEPQEAITPGQSVVLYDEDLVLGGGIIEEVIRDADH